MDRDFEGTDRGKRVVTNSGVGVGTVVRVDGDRAAVLLDEERSSPDRPETEVSADRLRTVTIDRSVVAHATNKLIRLVESTNLTDDRRMA